MEISKPQYENDSLRLPTGLSSEDQISNLAKIEKSLTADDAGITPDRTPGSRARMIDEEYILPKLSGLNPGTMPLAPVPAPISNDDESFNSYYTASSSQNDTCCFCFHTGKPKPAKPKEEKEDNTKGMAYLKIKPQIGCCSCFTCLTCSKCCETKTNAYDRTFQWDLSNPLLLQDSELDYGYIPMTQPSPPTGS
jgi:hypothetical protein